jgi:hypothetical protein
MMESMPFIKADNCVSFNELFILWGYHMVIWYEGIKPIRYQNTLL